MATNQVRASDLKIFTANPLAADPMVTAALLCHFSIPFSFLTVCVSTHTVRKEKSVNVIHLFYHGAQTISISSDTMMW